MKTINDYLNDLKEKTGSDNQSSILLNCQNSIITNMRKRNAASDENAVKIADALGIERTELLLCAAISRSSGETRNAWKEVAIKSGMAAGFVLYALPYELTEFFSRSCILCKIVLIKKINYISMFINNILKVNYEHEKTRPKTEKQFFQTETKAHYFRKESRGSSRLYIGTDRRIRQERRAGNGGTFVDVMGQ
ncbi:MAG TPA: hypothetical protein DGG95_03240 [Cytophagales bacterium]|jgi:hypothetical protein|nr:hypothetical protein [Cytophagales bacterium]